MSLIVHTLHKFILLYFTQPYISVCALYSHYIQKYWPYQNVSSFEIVSHKKHAYTFVEIGKHFYNLNDKIQEEIVSMLEISNLFLRFPG